MSAQALRQPPWEPAATGARAAPEGRALRPLYDAGAAHDAPESSVWERRIAELEDRARDLDTYASSVAHDLRAPLRAVRSYAQMLEEDHGPRLPEDARALVAKIVAAAQDMDRVIVDLLALSRADIPAAAMSHVDMRAIVSQALADLASERTNRVRIEVGELRDCRGHAALLRQIWANLLSNALKFTRGREAAVIEIGSFDADGVATWFVRDNGAGFEPDHAHELFFPLRRLHNALHLEGHGMGLAIVRRIVNHHGGRVWGVGRPGAGATFYFTLGAVTPPTPDARDHGGTAGT